MMRFWPSKKQITKVEELLGIVYENQSIFEQLKMADIVSKKERIEASFNTSKEREIEEMKKDIMLHFLSSTYILEQFFVAIPLKKYRLKQASEKEFKEFEKNKTVGFSISVEHFNKNTVTLFLEHYKQDKTEEVVAHTQRYIDCFLERKLTIWQKIVIWIKKALRLKKTRNKTKRYINI